jgi:hypothetical protein
VRFLCGDRWQLNVRQLVQVQVISPLSTSPTSITCIWCLYFTVDLICRSLFYIWSVFNLRWVNDKQVDVTRVSAVLLQTAFCIFYNLI